MPETLIGLDIGTTSICGVVIDTTGRLLTAVERPNDSAIGGLPPGRAEQDPRRIRDRAFEVLRTLADFADSPAALGLTGQMHGMLCLDARQEPTSPLITWQDGRCLERDPSGRCVLDEMVQRAGDNVWEVCGCRPASGFMGCTLYWMVRHGALPGGTCLVSFIHDWIAAQLAGTAPCTDPGDAGSAGIYDLQNLCWHAPLIKALSLPADLLPPVRESGEPIGHLTAAAAEATDLPAGTPVCNAIGDNQASVLGSIADGSRSILVNLGTGGQISWMIPAFRRVPGMETRYLPRRRFMLVGASLCGGKAYAWLNDVLRHWFEAFGQPVDREYIYARMTELAAAAPADCDGLRAVTTFAGTRSEPDRRGSFHGVSLTNFTLGNVARALLRGAVEELAEMYLRAGPSQGCTHETVVASGNAVRKNPLLREIIAGRFDRPVRIPRHREEAAFGAALMAGVGVGLWPDTDTAGRRLCRAD